MCTFDNAADALGCEMCGTERPGAFSPVPAPPEPPASTPAAALTPLFRRSDLFGTRTPAVGDGASGGRGSGGGGISDLDGASPTTRGLAAGVPRAADSPSPLVSAGLRVSMVPFDHGRSRGGGSGGGSDTAGAIGEFAATAAPQRGARSVLAAAASERAQAPSLLPTTRWVARGVADASLCRATVHPAVREAEAGAAAAAERTAAVLHQLQALCSPAPLPAAPLPSTSEGSVLEVALLPYRDAADAEDTRRRISDGASAVLEGVATLLSASSKLLAKEMAASGGGGGGADAGAARGGGGDDEYESVCPPATGASAGASSADAPPSAPAPAPPAPGAPPPGQRVVRLRTSALPRVPPLLVDPATVAARDAGAGPGSGPVAVLSVSPDLTTATQGAMRTAVTVLSAVPLPCSAHPGVYAWSVRINSLSDHGTLAVGIASRAADAARSLGHDGESVGVFASRSAMHAGALSVQNCLPHGMRAGTTLVFMFDAGRGRLSV